MLNDFSNQLADVVAAAAASVVQVRGRRRPASGLVYSNDVVITTLRAMGREDGLQVRSGDGRMSEAELVGWDPATGLAVLRVADLGAPAIALSDAQVRVGHLAIALARSWSGAITATAGVVAVIGGPLRTGRRRAIDQVFRTTAPMHDGFAGGAFLEAGGGLIGVATAAAIRGFGVIIPAAIAWKTAAMLLEHGRIARGYLGISGQTVSIPDHQRGATGRERGLLVMAVAPGEPAAKAQMLVGDVVLALDGTPLDSAEELMDLLQATGAGRAASVQVLRGATTIDLTVTTGERPKH